MHTEHQVSGFLCSTRTCSFFSAASFWSSAFCVVTWFLSNKDFLCNLHEWNTEWKVQPEHFADKQGISMVAAQNHPFHLHWCWQQQQPTLIMPLAPPKSLHVKLLLMCKTFVCFNWWGSADHFLKTSWMRCPKAWCDCQPLDHSVTFDFCSLDLTNSFDELSMQIYSFMLLYGHHRDIFLGLLLQEAKLALPTWTTTWTSNVARNTVRKCRKWMKCTRMSMGLISGTEISLSTRTMEGKHAKRGGEHGKIYTAISLESTIYL